MFAWFLRLFPVSRNMVFLPALALLLYIPHFSLGDELVISVEPCIFMQMVGKPVPFVGRYVTLLFDAGEIHLPQCFQDGAACILVIQPLFKKTVDHQCQEAGQEMCLDPGLVLEIHRAGLEISLHDPETFFDLPSLFTDLQDVLHIIFKKVCRDCIEPVVTGFFFYLCKRQALFYTVR